MFATSFPPTIRRGGRLYSRTSPVFASITNISSSSRAYSCPQLDSYFPLSVLFSSGFLPDERTLTSCFRISNQNGAP